MIQNPLEKQQLRIINTTAVLVFLLFPVGSYFLKGLDFAQGCLLGCVIVALNYYISQRLIAKLLLEQANKLQWLFVYFVKFTITIGVLYWGVLLVELSVWGVVVGLSTILITVVVSTMVKTLSVTSKTAETND